MPFFHPSQPIARRHGPLGYTDYTSYKDWLRDEFVFRCVYCLNREQWHSDGHVAFGVDHSLPKKRHPNLECVYTNLLYACNCCNTAKGEAETIDPTTNPLGKHLEFQEQNEQLLVVGRTVEGQDLIDILHLNEDPKPRKRYRYVRIANLRASLPDNPEIAKLYHDVFSFPATLPDLTLKNPVDNSKPEGLASSFHAAASKGNLPATYGMTPEEVSPTVVGPARPVASLVQ